MKDKQLRLRMSTRRYDKLKLYAEWKDKTMTQVIDELIDGLENPETDKKIANPASALTDS